MTTTAVRTEADVPGEVLRRIRRRWQTVVVAALVVTLCAWALAELQPKRYRAAAIAGLAPADNLNSTDLLRSVDSLDHRSVIATVAVLATTPLTRAQALAAFPPDFATNYTIGATVLPNTNLIRVEVEGDDPQHAAAVANRIASILKAQTQQMYKVYGVTIVSAAAPPTEAFSPSVSRSLAVGLVLGLLIGGIAAYANEILALRGMRR